MTDRISTMIVTVTTVLVVLVLTASNAAAHAGEDHSAGTFSTFQRYDNPLLVAGIAGVLGLVYWRSRRRGEME